MVRTYYEIYKTTTDYSQNLYRYPFIEVNVKKKLMEIPTFYFTLPRDANSELNAPAVGDKIKIYRNYGEILRGTILKMEVREDTLYFEGVSSADDWNYYDSDYLTWKMVNVSVILNRLGQDIGWTVGQVDEVLISRFDYDYSSYFEQLKRLANWVGREFYFDEINKKIDFKVQVGTDRSTDIRFKRGVNLDTITVQKEQDEVWDKVICLGAGEGRNQLKAVRGTGTRVKVFTDKSIKTQADLDKFADQKLAEGNKPLYVYYEADILPTLFNFEVGDTVWLEDEKNYINEAMRVMEYSLTFNETESVNVVLANKKKTLVDFFKNMEKGQRTLANVHHSSAVQSGSMILVDEDLNPIQINVANDQLVNTTTGSTIGAIENKANSAETIAIDAQNAATNAQLTAETALTQANTSQTTANNALTTANNALTQANNAQTTANTALSQANTATSKANAVLNSKPNLIKNGFDSFEHLPLNYTFYLSPTTTIGQLDTTYALDGQVSLKVQGTASGSDNYVYLGSASDNYNIPIFGGKSYIFSAYAYNPSTTPCGVKLTVRTSDGSFFYGTSTNIDSSMGWTKLSLKFQAPAGATACVLRVATTTANLPVWFDCLKLEEVDPASNDPTPWTPATLLTIDASKITTGYLSFDRARGGTLLVGGNANQNGRFQLYNANGEVIADFDGASNLVTIDTLQVGDIISSSVTSYGSLNKTIYVDPVNGNDEISSDQNSSTSPYKSIARALMDIPKFNNGTIDIYIMNSGTETVQIWGLAGGGVVNFWFQNNTLNGYIAIFGSTNIIKISNAYIHWTGDSAYAVVKVFRSKVVSLTQCTLWGKSQATSGFHLADGSVATLDTCVIQDNVVNNINVSNGSICNIINCTGKNAQYGVTVQNGSLVAGSGNAPTGASPYRELNGGKIQVQFSYTASNYNPTGTVDQIGTWSATSADSWRTVYNSWRGDSTVRQGQWTDSGGSYGLHTGLWFFGTAPSSTVTGKTIKNMRVYVKRKTTGGNGGPVTVYFRNHNYSSKPGGQPTVSSYYTTASFSAGEEKWVNLPSSFYADWQNGTAKGIAIYTSNSTNSYYAIFEPTCTLEITYA